MLKLEVVEYLRKADETLEVYVGKCNNVWVHNHNGYMTIFADLMSFARWAYKGESVPRKVCTLEEFDKISRIASDYEDIKLTEDRT